jgi:hypothetical protein
MSATRHNPVLRRVATPLHRQRGASLITAVFLITGLAVLGAMMTRMLTLSSTETISEWYSEQALYAAESGVDWAAHNIATVLEPAGTCPSAATPTTHNGEVIAGRAWFDVSISCDLIDSLYLYTISSTGKAGGSSANPQTQRALQVIFSPST